MKILQRRFDTLSHQSHLADWQFQQRVDALRLHFCRLLKVDWGRTFGWDDWMAPVQHLGRDHPTVARILEMIDRAVGA